MLSIFNLIPLAPLDGEKVLEFFLPQQALVVFDRIRPYAPLVCWEFLLSSRTLDIHVFEVIMTTYRYRAVIPAGSEIVMGIQITLIGLDRVGLSLGNSIKELQESRDCWVGFDLDACLP